MEQNATTDSTDLVSLESLAREYAKESKSESTRDSYRIAWARFEGWCGGRGVVALPAIPRTVALYLTAHATSHKPATLQRWLSAVAQAHGLAGHDDPTKAAAVRVVWRGIRRTMGTNQDAKAPIVTADLRRMADAIPDTTLGARDRALLLVGFAGAFRRSELVALDREDVQITSDGLVITVRRSKTDQEGQGRKVGIPYGTRPHTCPVRAFTRWVELSGVTTGPLLRSVNRHGVILPDRLTGQSVALVVKKLAAAVGIDATDVAGHSLRAGLATSAAAAGVGERDIMNQTGHKSATMVRRYIRDGSLFRSNAAGGVGL